MMSMAVAGGGGPESDFHGEGARGLGKREILNREGVRQKVILHDKGGLG